MSRVKTNFFANLAGSGWTALVGLACTPIYIHFMGMEAYGLIGFYFMLQGIIQILDLGLSPAMNREMARYNYRLAPPLALRPAEKAYKFARKFPPLP